MVDPRTLLLDVAARRLVDVAGDVVALRIVGRGEVVPVPWRARRAGISTLKTRRERAYCGRPYERR